MQSSSAKEVAAALLVQAVLADPTGTSAKLRYQLTLLCDQDASSDLTCVSQQDMESPSAFCDDLRSRGLAADSDLLCKSWQKRVALSNLQARRRSRAAQFQRHLLMGSLQREEAFGSESESAQEVSCAECQAALHQLESGGTAGEAWESLPSLPPAPQKLRLVSLEALSKPVTVCEVRKALGHIFKHQSLSQKMRKEAQRGLDQRSVPENFAVAIGAMLETEGRFWQWGDAFPHHHAVHGLKKCRCFCQPAEVLMMVFLEVLCSRLFPEVAKSLNPLQRLRHKHEVRGQDVAVLATLGREQRATRRRAAENPNEGRPLPYAVAMPGHRQRALLIQLQQLQQERLRLRQRFEFPLSHGFCYDGSSDVFATMFASLHAEFELCSVVHGTWKFDSERHTKTASEELRGNSASEASDGSDSEATDFEIVGEDLAVMKVDLRAFSNTVPHRLVLHCLRALGLCENWLAFFTRYMVAPLPSGRSVVRGLPLGPSLSTLLLEVVGSFLDAWLHRGFVEVAEAKTQLRKETSMVADVKVEGRSSPPVSACTASRSLPKVFGCKTPLLAMVRCGDDVWLLTRASDANGVWTRLRALYAACGLAINMDDSGSVLLTSRSTASVAPPPVQELDHTPCWSLLQLMPNCTRTIATGRVAARVQRAVDELEAGQVSLLSRVRVFNRHMDALLRQGGFHEELRQPLVPLHRSIRSFFHQAVDDFSKSTECEDSIATPSLAESLEPLLWWPQKSGGLGARHHLVLLTGDGSRISATIPPRVSPELVSLRSRFDRNMQAACPRNDKYDTHLESIFGPLILELFGTHYVLDDRYTKLLI